MRIVTWNIRNPSAARVPQIAEAVSELRPDVVVLTEYTEQASELKTRLSDSDLTGWVTSKPTRPLLGVAIASREAITSRPTSDPCPPWAGVLAVEVEGLHIVGLYGPGKKSHVGESKEPIKRRWWSGLLDECDRWRAEPTVIIGDFNNGTNLVDAPGNAFVHSDLFDALPAHGFQDGWRGIHGNAQDHSFEAWYGWRRLDHIFHSEHVKVLKAHYQRQAGDLLLTKDPAQPHRKAISDHAALVAEVELRTPARRPKR